MPVVVALVMTVVMALVMPVVMTLVVTVVRPVVTIGRAMPLTGVVFMAVKSADCFVWAHSRYLPGRRATVTAAGKC